MITKTNILNTPSMTETCSCSSDDNIISSEDETLPKKKFVFTFAVDEWSHIKPQTVTYKLNDSNRPKQNFKAQEALQKNQWTPVLAEHFWIHTGLYCCLSFRRATVNPNGKYFVTVFGRCKECHSIFKGTILDKPAKDARVLMQCTFTGNFDIDHSNKKRRLIGFARQKAKSLIVDKNVASETFREREANRLMKIEENHVCSSEAAVIAKTRLCDISPMLIHDSLTYELRGVISFHKSRSSLRNSVGHYTTYAKRESKCWELYDDLKKKVY